MNKTLRYHQLALSSLALAAACAGVQAQTTTDPRTPRTSPSTSPTTDSGIGASGGMGTGTGSSTGGSTSGSGVYGTPAGGSIVRMAAASSTPTYGGGADAYSLLPFTRRGYVGINVGRPELKADCGVFYGCDDPDASLQLYTGGMVNDWLGAELGYLNTGRADRAGGSTRSQGVNLSAVFKLPLGAFNVFGKAGGTYGETRVSTGLLSNVPSGKKRGWGASYGAGVGFDITPTSGLVLQWDRTEFTYPGKGRQDVDITSVGYLFRF
ncbi:MAG: outer membrane beta-barrel protein [Rubrivivax sp.]|nr:outer membrane beta-barrel protein [Rubrivivax sp.]